MATAEFNAMSPDQQAQVIRDFISQTYAAGGTDADVAAAMKTYEISPAQVQAAFTQTAPTNTGNLGIAGLNQAASSLTNTQTNTSGGMLNTTNNTKGNLGLSGLSQAASAVNQQQQAAAQQQQQQDAAQQASQPPAPVLAALTSPKLNEDQYKTLSNYFGNTVLPQDQNQIKDFVGKKSGFEFANYAATRDASQGGGNITQQQQQLQSLIAPFQQAPAEVKTRMVQDGDGFKPEKYITDPITGEDKAIRAVDEANNIYAIDYNIIGRAASDPAEKGYKPQLIYQIDPETNKATFVAGGSSLVEASGGFLEGLRPLAPMALAALGVLNAGTVVGEALGLQGTAAESIGNALVSGLATGAITGEADKALLASIVAGIGTAGVKSGVVGDLMDSLNLGDYKDVFGIKNSTQLANIGDVESQLGGFYGNTPNAIYNPQTGLTGLADGRVVAEVGNASGIPAGTYTQDEFIRQIQQIGTTPGDLLSGGLASTTGLGTGLTTTPTTGLGTGLTTTPTTDLGTGLTLPPNAGEMLGVGTAGAGVAGGIAGGTGLTSGAAGITGIGAGTAGGLLGGSTIGAGIGSSIGTGLGTAVGSAATSGLANTISNLLGNQQIQGLIGSGIDYARLNQLQNLASQQAQQVRQEATAAGQLANIPFTPYTVTSGAGTTAFGTDAAGRPTATVSSSPEYQALRQQALTQAGQAYGAINPATATQDYYANLQALQAPGQQIAQEQLLSNLGAKGLLGIGRNMPTVGQTGTSTVNPYIQSLLASQRQADLQNAVAAQQYGLQQAQGQAQLAGTLLGQGQGIDTQAMQTLTQGAGLGSTATQLNQAGAAKQLGATLAGMQIGSGYDLAALNAQAQAYGGAANAVKGLFGLPTTAGNTGSTNLVNQGINYLSGLFSQ